MLRGVKALSTLSQSKKSLEAQRQRRLAELSPFSQKTNRSETKRSVSVAELRPERPSLESTPAEDVPLKASASEMPHSTLNSDEFLVKDLTISGSEAICPRCSSEKNLVWFYTIAIDLSAIVTLAPAYLLLVAAGFYLSLSWAEGLSFALLFTVPLLINFSKRALCERCGTQIDPNGSKSEPASQNQSQDTPE